MILLKLTQESNRSSSKILGINSNTVNDYVHKLKASGLSYKKLLELDEDPT